MRTLSSALRDDDQYIRDMAAWILGRIADSEEQFKQALTTALQDGDENARSMAAKVLGTLKGSEAKFQLEMASSALGRVPNEEETEKLFDELASPKGYRYAPIEGLGQKLLTLTDDASDIQLRFRITEVLIRHLASPDAHIRQNAAYFLGKAEEAEAVPALIETVKDSDPNVKHFAAQALGRIKDPSAVPALVELFKDDSDNVRQTAALALGNIDDANARFYSRLFKGDIDEVEKEVQVGGKLDRVGELILIIKPRTGDKPFCEELYRSAVYAASTLLPYLESSVKGLKAKRFSERLTEVMIEVLSHENGIYRKSASYALAQINDPRARFHVRLFNGEIGDLAKKEDAWIETMFRYLELGPEIRLSVVRILGMTGCALEDRALYHKEIIDRLLEALSEDTDAEVRQAAADFLGRIALTTDSMGTKSWILENLTEALKTDSDSRVRASIAAALGRAAFAIKNKKSHVLRNEVLAAFGAAVVDENVDVRTAAVRGLGFTGDIYAVQPLIDVATNDKGRVRQTALNALGQVGIHVKDVSILTNKVIPALKKVLQDKNGEVRKAATTAIAELAWKRPEVRDITTKILFAALKDKYMFVRAAAAQGLLRSGDDATLAKRLYDPKARKQARRNLKKAWKNVQWQYEDEELGKHRTLELMYARKVKQDEQEYQRQISEITGERQESVQELLAAIEEAAATLDLGLIPDLEFVIYVMEHGVNTRKFAKPAIIHAQEAIERIKKYPAHRKILKSYVVITQEDEEGEASQQDAAKHKLTMLTTHLHAKRWARLAELGKFAKPAVDAVLEEFQVANPFTEGCVNHLSGFAEVGEEDRLIKAYSFAGDMARVAIVEFFGEHVSPKGLKFMKKVLLTDKYL
ncbi:MAG: sister chromatid cohesion protein PDS5, partial [Candidatus Omnitrophota bacterium]